MAFKVINPGLISVIQDFGRYGYQHIGVTTGGPMDEHAFLWANRLLDNAFDAAQLEITIGMLQLEVQQPTVIAMTGADLGATINGLAVRPWQSYPVNQGDQIAFNRPKTGLRAYLAVKGGLQITQQLGSAATVVRERIGGLQANGKKLATGDVLPYPIMSPSVVQPFVSKRVPEQFIPDYSAPLILGVILGYQCNSFAQAEIQKFFSNKYEITQDIDRMGYRLTGEPVNSLLEGIISEGISYGAIQIPKDGQPIVLLRDRQTIGGYPKIGCVTTLDAARLSQRGPGTKIRFAIKDIHQAEAERMIYNRFFGIQSKR
ncbi:biotin-dependent carboxyltransferase [Endozoicomonas sp. SM1973]|uniref:Biotin-dependent carboxyltransferase n=1 Tax=Spartinivicinus marinus TaxID=2994442 RepID=A0A853IEL9_9GAMM|nr:biotin-dependent carboxyltransferase family protein [Spartinivicinus marinus]NYZ65916.1 biotin-dependent carboxyltransferase [Spartinivicinus marinus]